MTIAASTTARPVLGDALGLRRVVASTWARTAVLVLAGALLTAAASQIRIPLGFSPVPITGGTFGVLLAGAALGPWRGAASQALYVAFGLVGLPYFAGGAQGTSGAEVVLGSSGGYFAGFVLAAALTGALARRGWDRGPLRTAAAFAAGGAIILALGTVWLAVVADLAPGEALVRGALPFLVGDALKALAAAALLPAAWRLVGDARR